MKKFFSRRILKIYRKLAKSIGYVLVAKEDFEHAKFSYSQVGEDAILNFLTHDTQYPIKSYIDIGACYPARINNTYGFYRKGARGVVIEANPSLVEFIKKVRPNDTVLNCVVCDSKAETIDFYVDAGTCSRDEALEREKQGVKINEIIKMPAKTLTRIIEENFPVKEYPDFLSIDIEGVDLVVLQSLDWEKYPIPIVCVETCEFSTTCNRPKDHTIEKYMTLKGYMVYADTYVNTIFVNKNFFMLRASLQHKA